MSVAPFLWTGEPSPDRPTVALAHGAGAPMDSPFMAAFADGLASSGIAVARFEFPYMQQRRVARGGRRPDPAPVLQETWAQVIAALDSQGISRRALVIGGKSLGGRMASMIADDQGVLGLVCLGYPFHPAGKPERTRVGHLATLATPALFVQGTRDALGNKEDVRAYKLSPAIHLHWLEDGDHSFKPRKSSGRTEKQNWDEGIAAVAAFVRELWATPRAL